MVKCASRRAFILCFFPRMKLKLTFMFNMNRSNEQQLCKKFQHTGGGKRKLVCSKIKVQIITLMMKYRNIES